MKIKLMKHNKRFKQKPTSEETGSIQKNIKQEEVDFEVLTKHCTRGGTIKPALLAGRSSDTWLSQQIYGLDFDHDTTVEEELERAKQYGIEPLFGYTTFSHSESEPRFRVFFCTEIAVDDIRLRNIVQYTLMKLFPKADQSTRDPARLFYGGKKGDGHGLICSNEDARISIFKLVNTYVSKLKEEKINFLRNVNSYCEVLGVNSINGLPAITLISEEDVFDSNAPTSYIYYRARHEIIKIEVNITKEKALEAFNEKASNKKPKRNKIKKVKNIIYEEDKNFDFDKLEKSCMLYKGYVDGSHWAYHNEVFMMTTNLYKVRGGRKRLLEALEYDHYEKNKSNLTYTIDYTGRYGYAPAKCSTYCTLREECDNQGLNMLHSVDNKRCQTRRIEKTKTIPLEEAADNMKDEILDVLAAEDSKMNLIKGAMGLGKTEIITNLEDYTNMCICAPTHKLAAEIAKRVNCDDFIHMKELVITEEEEKAKYNNALMRGDSKKANYILEEYIRKLSRLQKTEEREAEIQDIIEYIDNRKRVRYTNKLIICTHKRMLTLKNDNIKTYIVDEDFLMNTVIQTVNLNPKVIDKIIKHYGKVAKGKTNLLIKCLHKLKECVGEAIESPKLLVKFNLDMIYKKEEMESLLEVLPDNINVNIKEMLSVSHLVANEKKDVIGMFKNNLPSGKFVILSGTASPEIYKNIFGQDINVVDIEQPKSAGKYIHHTFSGCSRSYMRKGENLKKLIERIKSECTGIKNLITYKSFEEDFKAEGFNTICHFGACQGIDEYKGEDLIVVGTPHIDERIYMLMSSLMNQRFVISDEMQYRNIKHNGFEFWMYTYEGSTIMQKIQLYLIESDLAQAIGRARAIREDVTVHVYSSIPFPCSVLYEEMDNNETEDDLLELCDTSIVEEFLE